MAPGRFFALACIEIAFFTLAAAKLMANDSDFNSCTLDCCDRSVDFFAEVKGGYFYPTSHKFRDIYSGGGIYGLELSCQAWQQLYGWASGDIFYKSGHSQGLHHSTHITMVPLGAGLKYLFPVSFSDIYLGAGVLGTYLHMKDRSPYVIRSLSKWGAGGIFKAGVLFNFKEHYFVDLFSNYTIMNIDFHNTDHNRVIRHTAHLSGWTVGLGIGYRYGRP